jgi:hypothetical protein
MGIAAISGVVIFATIFPRGPEIVFLVGILAILIYAIIKLLINYFKSRYLEYKSKI